MTYATIKAQDIEIPMPRCKVDIVLNEGDVDQGRRPEAEGLAHAGPHRRASSASRWATCSSAATTSTRTAASASSTPTTARTSPTSSSRCKRILKDDAEFLLPSHGPVFRRDNRILQKAIDRLTQYQYMADFGTCAVAWPLLDEWEEDVLGGQDAGLQQEGVTSPEAQATGFHSAFATTTSRIICSRRCNMSPSQRITTR